MHLADVVSDIKSVSGNDHPTYNSSTIESIEGNKNDNGDYVKENGQVNYSNGDYEESKFNGRGTDRTGIITQYSKNGRLLVATWVDERLDGIVSEELIEGWTVETYR